jgi:pimeloyl-ACP methyl ester carboxylesterase
LSKRPQIAAPTITLFGADDGIGGSPAEASAAERAALPALVAHRVIAGAGHFLPRERPEAVSAALLELLG